MPVLRYGIEGEWLTCRYCGGEGCAECRWYGKRKVFQHQSVGGRPSNYEGELPVDKADQAARRRVIAKARRRRDAPPRTG